MTIQFSKAQRTGQKVLLGIAGPSHSGKTYSALAVATGIKNVEGGSIFVIDTESGRAGHYADQFDYQIYQMTAPFSPERYLAAIEAAHKAGASIIVIDSMSHEHEGDGGLLDMHEAELQRMAGNDWGKRERVKFTAWIKPKDQHKKLVNRILQLPVHIIFCFRAKDKLVMKKNAQGKNEPVSAGWTPIVASGLDYEMTALLVLPQEAQGRPDFKATATKLPNYFHQFAHDGMQLSQQFGESIAQWANGSGALPKEGQPAPQSDQPAPQSPPQSSAEHNVGATPSSGVLSKYHAELAGCIDRDMLATAHAGFKHRFEGVDTPTRNTAQELFQMHQKRIAGTISADDCNEAAAMLTGAG
ncbi:MAG: AAA family ATPase [Pseudomonadota bacterium]